MAGHEPAILTSGLPMLAGVMAKLRVRAMVTAQIPDVVRGTDLASDDGAAVIRRT